MIEMFKDIKDLEGLYQVSNFGNIMSLNYGRTGKPKLLKPCVDGGGYLLVSLYKNRKRKSFKVHRLVAETFLPNPNNLSCINHKIEGDEGKTINMVIFNEDGTIDKERTTIEWVTYDDNSNYGNGNKRIIKANTNGKLTKKVLQFTLDGEFVKEWESTRECKRNGFSQGNIVSCCNGKLKTYKGFIWRYKKEVV